MELHVGLFKNSLGYQPLRKREEVSGNIAILLLCKWNVMNVIFTTLWTATQVAVNQNHRTLTNDYITTYWCDSKPIAHRVSKYCTWRRYRSCARPHWYDWSYPLSRHEYNTSIAMLSDPSALLWKVPQTNRPSAACAMSPCIRGELQLLPRSMHILILIA